jgi:hypothetical protein
MSKKLIPIWVLFSVVMELWVIFNCCKCPPVKYTSWAHCATLNQLEHQQSAEAATCNLCRSQPSGSMTCGGILESMLKAQVIVNWRQFQEVNLNLYFKLIRDYACLFFVPFIFNNPYFLFQVSSGRNSITIQKNTCLYKLFWSERLKKSFPAVMSICHELPVYGWVFIFLYTLNFYKYLNFAVISFTYTFQKFSAALVRLEGNECRYLLFFHDLFFLEL